MVVYFSKFKSIKIITCTARVARERNFSSALNLSPQQFHSLVDVHVYNTVGHQKMSHQLRTPVPTATFHQSIPTQFLFNLVSTSVQNLTP